MSDYKLELVLRPTYEGAYTQMLLQGQVRTEPQPRQMRRLLATLSRWHGGPVDVALSVDGTVRGSMWLELWDAAIEFVPRDIARIRLLLEPARSRGGADE